MRAWLLDEPGAPETLRLGSLPDPTPGPGEALVRVVAVGLNPVDYKLLARGWPTWEWPHVPGVDLAGEVVALGSDAAGLAVGDRLCAHVDMTGQGTFAELARVAAHTAARLPEGVSYEAAAALPCAGYTAWQAIRDRLDVGPGQTVLVQGAAGGVGGFAVQLAHLAGARVFATCSAAKAEWVRGLGATATLDYQHEDVDARLRELTDGAGVDRILDCVDRASATAGMRRLAYAGGLVHIAGRPEPDTVPGFTTAPSVHEVALGACYSHGGHAAQAHLGQIGDALLALLAEGRLDPLITDVLAWSDVAAGLAQLATRRVRGKLVARVS